jgi:hypothetical protein
MKGIFLADLILNVWQRIPGAVDHNLEKARVLKRIFWHLNVDQVKGDYVEFGVAMGHSMRSAEMAERTSHSRPLGINRIERRLIGFDTFTGFSSNSELDTHPTWSGSNFNASYQRVCRRFRRHLNKRIFLNETNACDLNTRAFDQMYKPADLGLRDSAAIVLLDMDLYEPTFEALKYLTPILQQGTFLIFDEYYAFAGRTDRGEAKALNDWLTLNPAFSVRDFSAYGSGGRVFVLNQTS